MAHTWDAAFYFTCSFTEGAELARPLAHKAVALDGGDAMAHFALFYVFGLAGDRQGCRAEAEYAVQLDPNNAWVLSLVAAYHTFDGQPNRRWR